MDSWFLTIATLVTVTALFAWVSASFFKLPQTIGLLIMGLSVAHRCGYQYRTLSHG